MEQYTYAVFIVLQVILFVCDHPVTAEFEFDENSPLHGIVHLEDGGYKGILVAVDPSVAYDPVIYGNIIDYLQQASDVLAKATSKISPVYFKEATLLLPHTWPKLPQCERVTSEIQSHATFLIGPDTKQWGSIPHTQRHSSQCGEPGLVTILPESFVKNRDVAKRYGDNIGKTIVHEWAHLRYGVFDETTDHIGGDSCIWAQGEMYPIKCSANIKGITRPLVNGKGCEFIPNEYQPENVTASLMYKHYLKNIDTFCDNNTSDGALHNDKVPNPHNDRCDGKSVWEVLRMHSDFKLLPRTQQKPPDWWPPSLTLRCVQSRELARMVLTMDVSSSMKTMSRILRMQQDVHLFLTSIPCRDTSIGLVEFSAKGTEKILHPMVSLENEVNLGSLLDAVPNRVINRTCIGCGIIKAIQTIEQSGQPTQGAVIVVFTDGLENDHPMVANVTPQVLQAGIVVYGILLLSTAENHPLIKLAQLSGGTSCVYTTDSTQRSSYYDCLESILLHRAPASAPVQVMSTQKIVPQNDQIVGTVIIDRPLAKNALISINWDDSFHIACQGLEVTLITPANAHIGPSDTNRYNKNDVLRSITIDISGYEFGIWTYTLHNRVYAGDCKVRLLIEGRQHFSNCSILSARDEPVILEPQLSTDNLQLETSQESHGNAIKLYVGLLEGSNPVIGAQVKAEVHSTYYSKIWSITMWDNGAGADYMDQDGIYSHYFTDHNSSTAEETYNVKFDVTWTATTKLQMSTFNRGDGAPSKPQYTVKPDVSYAPVQPFQRSSRTIFFNIKQGQYSICYAPAKIADLRVNVLQSFSMVLTLTFTAVGAWLDEGVASSYDIRVDKVAWNLRNQYENALNLPIQFIPKPAGEKESLTIALKDYETLSNETTYYIAIRAINNDLKKGPVSNVQMVFIKSTLNSQPGPESGIQLDSTPNPVHVKSALPSWLWYIIGVVTGLVFLLLVLCCICVVKKKRKTQDKNEEKDEELGKENSVISEEFGVSNIETSMGQNAPDILNEIQLAKSNLKKKKRFKKKKDGEYTISSRASRSPGSKHANIANKSQRKNIFKSLRKTGLFSSSKRLKMGKKKAVRQSIHKPWMVPHEPIQNHAYSNPLFGDSSIVPEVSIANSVIMIK